MNTNRNVFRLAALALLAAGAFSAMPHGLAAQGRLARRRPAAVPPSTETPAAPSLVEPARTMLRHLVGRWRFEIRFAGNFDGPPDASGTRVVDTLFGDLRLQWTEVHDGSPLVGQGIIGFDTQTGRLYSSAVMSAGSGMEVLTGTVSPVEPVITFNPDTRESVAGRQGMESFTWTMVDPDHFLWAPFDRGWRALFTRMGPP